MHPSLSETHKNEDLTNEATLWYRSRPVLKTSYLVVEGSGHSLVNGKFPLVQQLQKINGAGFSSINFMGSAFSVLIESSFLFLPSRSLRMFKFVSMNYVGAELACLMIEQRWLRGSTPSISAIRGKRILP